MVSGLFGMKMVAQQELVLMQPERKMVHTHIILMMVQRKKKVPGKMISEMDYGLSIPTMGILKRKVHTLTGKKTAFGLVGMIRGQWLLSIYMKKTKLLINGHSSTSIIVMGTKKRLKVLATINWMANKQFGTKTVK